MYTKFVPLCLGAALGVSLLSLEAAEKEKKPVAIDVSKIPPASTKENVTYAADIKPIFDESCVRCHGAERPKAKLRLDSLEGVLKGGEDGKVIKPGDSAGSVLVQNVAHVCDPDNYMPPPNNKAKIPPLTKAQIGLIRAWVDQGAK